MRGCRPLILKRDPPPDLTIEIDISSPSVAKEPFYAALGVREIWRSDGSRIRCLHWSRGRATSESTAWHRRSWSRLTSRRS